MKYRFIGLRWTDGVGQLTGHADSAGQAGARIDLIVANTDFQSFVFASTPIPFALVASYRIAALDTCPLVW